MKKGFTLVELLAVIVLLAIIALIAVPIIINIISDTKEQSELRSAELYVHAVNLALMDKSLTTKIDDAICIVLSDGNLNCDGVRVNVSMANTIPSTGVITIHNGEIVRVQRLLIGNNIYKTDENGKIVLSTGLEDESVAILISGSTLPDDYSGNLPESYGSKYLVYVNDTTPLSFYVIGENGDGTTNLILERNICSNGSYATAQNLCKLAWITAADYTQAGGTSAPMMGNGAGVDKGPVTAMNYLNQATSGWTNITYDYSDYDDEGGKFTDFEITGHARLPYKSEIQQFAIDGSNRFLYDYLAQSSFMTAMSSYPIQTNAISGLSGYWLFSSDSSNAMSAYMPYASIAPSNGGSMTGATNFSTTATNTTSYGIRPVITIEL